MLVILAGLICWIPFLGLLALPVGALGLLLGVIGLLMAIIGRRSGLAASIVETGISLGAIALSFAVTGAASKAISDAMKTETGPVAQASKPVEGDASGALTGPALAGARASGCHTTRSARKEAEWVVAPTPANVLGDKSRSRLSRRRLLLVALERDRNG